MKGHENRHREAYRPHPEARGLVVFIHGFMGSPRQLADYAQAAYDRGFSVLSVLLPGHGDTAGAFIRSGAAHWRGHLMRLLRRYSAAYDTLFLVGHSMGGLLALEASTDAGLNVRGVAAVCTPMRVRLFGLRSALRRLSLPFRGREDAVGKAYRAGRGVPLRPIYMAPLFLRPLGQLFLLMRETRALLPSITVPVLLIHSRCDETVSPASAEIFQRGLVNAPWECLPLQNAWHAHMEKGDREAATQAILRFIETNITRR